MLHMLTRRAFGKVMAGAAVLPGRLIEAQEAPRRAGLAALQFSVMIWTLRQHGTFEENLEQVAVAGYSHVELTGEFSKWSNDDWQRISARMQALKLSVDATGGMKHGFADPSGADAFIAELKTMLPAVKRLGCRQIILLSGKRVEGSTEGAQHAASIEALKYAADLLDKAGVVGVIEPIDTLENPTIYLNGVTEAFDIVRAVGSPSVKVLYDLYHEQREHGNLIEKLEKNIDAVALIHIADVPGRHEPGTGEINYGNIYRRLTQLNYKGGIAMEFHPVGDVVETLRRAREEAMRA